MKKRVSRRVRGFAAAALAILGVLPAGGAMTGSAADGRAAAGDAVASITGSTAQLTTNRIRRTWQIPAAGSAGVRTTVLQDRANHREWASPMSNDVTINLGGLVLDSSNLALQSLSASRVAGDPRIPGAGAGARLSFR